MADIKAKDIKLLDTWTAKELRKLRMVAKNRISSLEKSSSPKVLPSSHPLFNMEVDDIKSLLDKVVKAEKA